MNTEREDEILIEAVTSAHREHRLDGVRSLPAWHDLDDEGRRAAYDATVRTRTIEAALDPEGLTGTAHALHARIRNRP